MTASASNVVGFLPGQATTSFPEAVRAALRAEHARHAAAVEAILSGIVAGTGDAPPSERRVSKKQAVRELGMDEQRLTRLIVRYREAYPDRPKLAVQPAGMKHARWEVYIDRVIAMIASGEPY